MKHEEALRFLEVGLEAGDEEIRSAYLRKVKEFPPDRSPREFERVREAYEMLRDPRQRTRNLLFSVDPNQSLVSLLDSREPERRFIGPAAWLAALQEKQFDKP